MEYYIGLGMWGFLGIFAFTVVVAMLFGMVRGTKRTLKRMVLVIPCFILALLITPLISRGAYMLGRGPLMGLVDGLIGDNEMIGAALEVDGVEGFVVGLPLIIVNIIVFYVLLFFFRYIVTPIVSVLFLRKVAPKRDADGNKIKHSKLAGLGLGALFGVLIFAFMWIPMTGLMSSLDRVDGYEPRIVKMEQVDFMEGTGNDIIDGANQIIRTVNTEVSGSAMGAITKYSGMQMLGRFGLGHLATIKAGGVRANMVREVEVFAELSRDAVVIYNFVSSIDFENPQPKLAEVFGEDKDVAYFESVINKIFDRGVVKLVLDANFDEFLRKANFGDGEEVGVLGGVDFSFIVGEDEDLQHRFREAIYDGIGKIGSDFFREDILALLNVARLAIVDHRIGATEERSLWMGIEDAILVMTCKDSDCGDCVAVGGITGAFDNLHRVLTFKDSDWDGSNLAERVFGTVGEMNIFKNLLFHSEDTDLYSLPVSNFLGLVNVSMEPEEVVIDFGRVMGGLANIVTRVVNIGPTAYKLIDSSGSISGIAEILSENDGAAIVAVGEILEILTNSDDWIVGGELVGDTIVGGTPTMGTGTILRQVISSLVVDNIPEMDSGDMFSLDSVLDPLLEKLAPGGPDIEWAKELSGLVKIVQEVGDLLTGDDIDIDKLIDKLLSGDLVDIIADSELLSGIIVGVLDGVINGALPDGISFNFDDADNADVIKALGSLVGDVTQLITDMEDTDVSDFNNILNLFGGSDGGDDNALVKLADSGLKIEVDGDLIPGLEESLKLWGDSLVDEIGDDGLPIPNPLKKILGMFDFGADE